jgi:hypothetical protein
VRKYNYKISSLDSLGIKNHLKLLSFLMLIIWSISSIISCFLKFRKKFLYFPWVYSFYLYLSKGEYCVRYFSNFIIWCMKIKSECIKIVLRKSFWKVIMRMIFYFLKWNSDWNKWLFFINLWINEFALLSLVNCMIKLKKCLSWILFNCMRKFFIWFLIKIKFINVNVLDCEEAINQWSTIFKNVWVICEMIELKILNY